MLKTEQERDRERDENVGTDRDRFVACAAPVAGLENKFVVLFILVSAFKPRIGLWRDLFLSCKTRKDGDQSK